MNYTTIPFEVSLPNQNLVFSPTSLYAKLSELPDLRGKQGIRYPLAPLLTIVVLAKLCGQNQITEVAHWAKLRTKELCEFFGLPTNTLPHLTTWARVLAKAVDSQALTKLVAEFLTNELNSALAQEVTPTKKGSLALVLDGKSLRGTIPLGSKRGVHLVAAYLPQEGIVMAQVEVSTKQNEITVAPKLLSELDLKGKVVLGDAMYCQRELSVKVVEGGGDYVWITKANQKSLQAEIAQLFEAAKDGSYGEYAVDFEQATTLDCRNGRIEQRQITTSAMLNEYSKWPHLGQVFKIESIVQNRYGKIQTQVRYGVTSLGREVADAQRLLSLVRQQWGIENGLHYRRDVTLREDYSRLKNKDAAIVNAIFNNLTVGLVIRQGRTNLAATRREYAYLPQRALHLLLT